MTDVSTTNVSYQPVPVPGAGEDPTAERLRREVDTWIGSPAFAELAAGEGAAPSGTLAERLAYLDGFSAAAWDFRGKAARESRSGYRERNQVDRDEVGGGREAQVLSSARALGLVDARPPARRHYQHVLVLGGLVRANLWRTAYAAHLIRTGAITTPDVTGLTAFRALARNEQDATQDEYHLLDVFGRPARDTEADVMEDSLIREFGLGSLTVHDHGGEEVQRFKVASAQTQDLRVSLVAAPNPTSAQRADTGTTMRYWAQEVAHIAPGDSILFVTSCIYVPFQHAVAVQNLGLPFGARVETVGVDHTVVDSQPLPQTFRGVNYLQELRSSIRAFRQLLEKAGEISR